MNSLIRPDVPAFIQIILGICVITLCILLLMSGSALIDALRDYLFTSHNDGDDDETDYEDEALYTSDDAEAKRRARLHHLLMCGSLEQAKPLVEVWNWSPSRQKHILVGVKVEGDVVLEEGKRDKVKGIRGRLHPLDRAASIFEKSAEDDNLAKLEAEMDAEAIAAAAAQHGLVEDPDEDALPPLTKPLPNWLKACADEVKAKTEPLDSSFILHPSSFDADPPTKRIERPLTTLEQETLERIHQQHEADQYHAQRAREKRLSEQHRRDSAAEMESGWPAVFEGDVKGGNFKGGNLQ
jgi:hypothetical protein